MVLKRSYKQTEVGVIPGDWEIDIIKNHASIKTGGRNTQDRISDGEYPFFVRSAIVERINTYSFDGEAVLTAGDGVGTGKVFHYINGKFDLHQRVYRISNFSDKLFGYFFYLYFSTHFYDRIMSMTAKSSVDSVRMDMIAKMKIPLPPLPEQRAIADALSEVDALLASLDALITKKRLIQQGAMQELLTGKRRLLGFIGVSGYKQTELGIIPDDWSILFLKDLCTFENGDRGENYPSRTSFVSGGIPFINAGHLEDGHIDLKEMDYISRERFELLRSGKVRHRDLLFCLRGSLGKFGIVGNDISEGAIASSLVIVRPRPANLDYLFLSWYFRSNYCSEMIEKWSGGAAQPNLGVQDLARFAIPVPPTMAEQTAIGAVLSDMYAEIHALKQQREKTQQIKQGMMQELLTGRTRLV